MAFGFSLTVTSDIAKNLRALAEAVSKEDLAEGLDRAGEPMRALMASYARRGPEGPHLADNIVIGAPKVDKDSGGLYVPVGPSREFFYDWFLEFGTRRMSAKPFMRPGFDGAVKESLTILQQWLWASVSSKVSPGGTGNL